MHGCIISQLVILTTSYDTYGIPDNTLNMSTGMDVVEKCLSLRHMGWVTVVEKQNCYLCTLTYKAKATDKEKIRKIKITNKTKINGFLLVMTIWNVTSTLRE